MISLLFTLFLVSSVLLALFTPIQASRLAPFLPLSIYPHSLSIRNVRRAQPARTLIAYKTLICPIPVKSTVLCLPLLASSLICVIASNLRISFLPRTEGDKKTQKHTLLDYHNSLSGFPPSNLAFILWNNFRGF